MDVAREQAVVIGGGAAGMIAAAAAAENGRPVILLEKNEKLGKKLYITGKGRCNVTNACSRDKLFVNIVSNPKFLYSAFHEFDNSCLIELLKENGCSLKVERGERVFPVSDHASDVTAAMERLLRKRGVQIRLGSAVRSILTEDGQVAGVRLADGSEIPAESVILATGGLSYRTTGSSGDGHRMAQELGHKIKDCVPALVPLEIQEDWCKKLQGLSLKNVSLVMTCGKKKLYQGFGEMLFTHFGVSGPLVLSASSYCGKAKDPADVWLTVDLKPALEPEQLDKRILRDFEENVNRQFKNALGGLYPAKLIPVMIERTGIEPEKKVHEITKQERRRLAELTKQFTMQVQGKRGFEEAVITQGGVAVKEVNPSTMESRLVKGLYFAGEILDLDALTGGFNLQIAWSTGYLAGTGCRDNGKENRNEF
ncbi:MAG: NAD(P)/FAD-dependent oxidoreductase [Lachnospiraceae bacterium]|nr:NAD(P)/FAD-dependent oxidoreductase [Lachnospiraceae bacterium]